MASRTNSTKKVEPKKVPVVKLDSVKAKKNNATKKVTTKKSTKNAKIPLIKAPEDKQFWVTDGQILADLRALAESFSAMEKLVYRYHTENDRNDFADWVEHVLCDADCAMALRQASTPKQAKTVVIKRLKLYE